MEKLNYESSEESAQEDLQVDHKENQSILGKRQQKGETIEEMEMFFHSTTNKRAKFAVKQPQKKPLGFIPQSLRFKQRGLKSNSHAIEDHSQHFHSDKK